MEYVIISVKRTLKTRGEIGSESENVHKEVD